MDKLKEYRKMLIKILQNQNFYIFDREQMVRMNKWLEELEWKRSCSLAPCKTTNNVVQQIEKLHEELAEVEDAYMNGRIEDLAEEIVDLQTAGETLMFVLGYCQRQRDAVRLRVKNKNAERNYLYNEKV